MASRSTYANATPCVTRLLSVVAVALLGRASHGEEFLVRNAAEVSAAMRSAQPGDTLVMANGIWTNQQIDFAGDGVAGAPITLRAQTPGGVTLNGASTLSISGDHLVADGLNFDGGALTGGHVVQFRGSNGEATNSRFTNSAIVNYNPTSIDTRYFWVSLYGQSNRVDNNFFSGQNHSGVTVTVWRDDASPDFHQIDSNHFADRPEGNGNGFETIRLGTSSQSLSDSFTVVENNLFERTDGEIEIISNKSGSNTFRHNTFRESAGTLTLRHGDDNTVEGNFFLGENKNRSGGVRVIGERQTLINNYFANLDGRAGGAISISAAVENSQLNEYFQVREAVIAHNSIFAVREAAITFDDGLGSSGRTLLAEDVTVANNLIVSTSDPLFEGNEGAGWIWEGNIAFGQSLGPVAGNPGVTVTNPQVSLGPDGLIRPSPLGPAIDAATNSFNGLISTDLDGQPRSGAYDVGADEFSTTTIVRVPLTAADVGPAWLTGPGPDPDPDPDPNPGGGGGCDEQGCAIQAESFTSISDPDGNGLSWTITDAQDALGGQVLKAPEGDRIDLSTEAHDAIAAYELMFETAGVYTAYFRARGFSGSTDSLYFPDDFGVDPDNNRGLTSNGVFDWEKDAIEFTITPSLVGVPLELRLAMREQQAELDAIVLSLESNLTDAQLDELFAAIPGDYNGDGLVDAADYAVWRDTLTQTGSDLAADGNGDSVIGPEDYDVWAAAVRSTRTSAATATPEPGAMALTLLAVSSLPFRRRHSAAFSRSL